MLVCHSLLRVKLMEAFLRCPKSEYLLSLKGLNCKLVVSSRPMSEGEIDWQIAFFRSRVILNVDNVDKRIPLIWIEPPWSVRDSFRNYFSHGSFSRGSSTSRRYLAIVKGDTDKVPNSVFKVHHFEFSQLKSMTRHAGSLLLQY